MASHPISQSGTAYDNHVDEMVSLTPTYPSDDYLWNPAPACHPPLSPVYTSTTFWTEVVLMTNTRSCNAEPYRNTELGGRLTR
jgi:hypothetical protein